MLELEYFRTALRYLVSARFAALSDFNPAELLGIRTALMVPVYYAAAKDAEPTMIEKLEFYHGAAIVRIIEDARCMSVAKHECGYLVNTDRLVFLKYTTKTHSPWRFTVTDDDIARLEDAAVRFPTCVLALVCGGDGICAISWGSARELLGEACGWLAAKRSFNECYAVTGPAGSLRRKVALNQWPGILFRQEEE